MSSKVKILHIIKSLGRGGAERLLTETIRQHDARFQFDIVYFLPWKYQMVDELKRIGCRVYLLPATKTPFMLWRVFDLVKLIRTNKYDLIHCHLPWAGIVGRFAGKITHIPVVYTEHNNYFTYNIITRIVHKILFTWFTKVIAVSNDARQALFSAVGKNKNICTILNGVNTESFSRLQFDSIRWKEKLNILAGKTVISTVAVFRQQKRLDRWLDIAVNIIKNDTNVVFIIIGDGDLKNSLIDHSEKIGLGLHVTFAGLVEDPRPFLACTDIYLMSSDYEGLPVALLEAMSMECVPVVTSVGGIPGVVDESNGILYEKDDVDRVTKRIVELIKDEKRRRAYSMKARETVLSKFSMNRMVIELEAVYNDVLKINSDQA